MIEVRPFRALHYNQSVVGDLAAVIAPPYDVIDTAQHARLYARSPHNAVRLILNREADRYAAAAGELQSWRAKSILIEDDTPALQYYVQDFRLAGGVQLQRRGLIAALRLEEFAKGNVRPHEKTFARAKEDRLRLIEACRANLSPLFGMVPDHSDALAPARSMAEREPPWIDVTDEAGERHRVWRIVDPASIRAITEALAPLILLIADGHHRYETALHYRDRRRSDRAGDREAPYELVLMYITPMDDPGLVILPTHRVLAKWTQPSGWNWTERLEADFLFEKFPRTTTGEAALLAKLNAQEDAGSFGLCVAGGDEHALLRLRNRQTLDEALSDVHPSIRYLDSTVLDRFVLRRLLQLDCTRAAQDGILTYTHEDERPFEAVERDGAAAAFLVRPPRIADVQAACDAGETMPEKSTYFYPKLLTGLVFRALD